MTFSSRACASICKATLAAYTVRKEGESAVLRVRAGQGSTLSVSEGSP